MLLGTEVLSIAHPQQLPRFLPTAADQRLPLCRPLNYTDLCGPSKGCVVSPFETALTLRGASAPRLSFQAPSPPPFLSPFDSVKSFPSFLSAASFPSDHSADVDLSAPPATRASTISPLEASLGHFDLDRRDTALLHDCSSSQPPSPKTPHQGESFTTAGYRQGNCWRIHSEDAPLTNPISGHPRHVLLYHRHSLLFQKLFL